MNIDMAYEYLKNRKTYRRVTYGEVENASGCSRCVVEAVRLGIKNKLKLPQIKAKIFQVNELMSANDIDMIMR